jgi:hypothetical protein
MFCSKDNNISELCSTQIVCPNVDKDVEFCVYLCYLVTLYHMPCMQKSVLSEMIYRPNKLKRLIILVSVMDRKRDSFLESSCIKYEC